ncbi:hypothetical protein Bca52824_046749 [Brassica carinata]|uniref:Uncharacterized protein n=1 Tax=Brassica carinata TaxID=52824 RepID=A0A8X7UPC4_BRACI|nr:hypothetical protein Bca52824_046749 [Brassica carinata]
MGCRLTSKALLKVSSHLRCKHSPSRSFIGKSRSFDGTCRLCVKEVYGSDASDGFNKGKAEPWNAIVALLRLSNEHRLSEIELLQAANKANSIASQIELLEEIIKAKGKFDFTAELEKLKEKLMEADGMLADVKVKIPDWCKLEEKWLWMSNLML